MSARHVVHSHETHRGNLILVVKFLVALVAAVVFRHSMTVEIAYVSGAAITMTVL